MLPVWPVVSAAVPYPRSRFEQVLAIIAQHWDEHRRVVSDGDLWVLPDDSGDEMLSSTESSDWSDTTDPNMPGLSAPEEDEFHYLNLRIWSDNYIEQYRLTGWDSVSEMYTGFLPVVHLPQTTYITQAPDTIIHPH